MPELPEVEIFRRQVASDSLHRPVERVRSPDPEVLDDTGDRALTRTLRGLTFREVRRHGQHLLIEVSGGGVLGLSFGPTAYPTTGPVPDEHHLRLIVTFADGAALSLLDQGRTSRVTLADTVEQYVAARRLGPDAMALSAEDLRDLVRASKDELKATLTDQQQIAGLGDVYTDELLFQARIDPRTPGRAVDEQACRRLHRMLHRVVGLAVQRDADPARLPRTWLLPHREHGVPCPRGRGTVRQFRSRGQTGYWCPGCQSG